MMKFFKPILITATAIAIVISILIFNKSKMAAQAESPKSDKPIVVKTILAEKKRLDQSLRSVGAIEAEHDVAIISETQGKVVKVLAQVGSALQAGDGIVQVDSEIKYANFIAAEAQFEKSKKDVERYQILHRENGIPENELEQARLNLKQAEANYIVAKRQFSDATIRSPISGVLTERKYNIGEMIQPDSPVATVVNTSSLKIKVFVSENDVMKLRIGAAVQISVDIYPNKLFAGKIKSISDKASDAGAYPVEVALSNNRETPLKVGMTARIIFSSQSPYHAVILPRLAIQSIEKNAFVYAIENGVAAQKPVVTGKSAGSDVEIISGLNGGERIVTSGQTLLKNGMPVSEE